MKLPLNPNVVSYQAKIAELVNLVSDANLIKEVVYGFRDPWHIIIFIQDTSCDIIDNHILETILFEVNEKDEFKLRLTGNYGYQHFRSYETEDFEVAKKFILALTDDKRYDLEDFYEYDYIENYCSPNRNFFKEVKNE